MEHSRSKFVPELFLIAHMLIFCDIRDKTAVFHLIFIFSFPLHFLAARLPGCHNLCNPDDNNILATTWETASQILHNWLTNHLQSKCHLKVLIVFSKFLVLSFTIYYLWRIIFQSIHLNSHNDDKDSWEKQPVEVIEQLQVWSALDNNKKHFKEMAHLHLNCYVQKNLNGIDLGEGAWKKK